MVRAALALHEVGQARGEAAAGDRDYRADAVAWMEALLRHHREARTGLLNMAADDATDVIMRLAPTQDDAIPNSHAVALPALVRLSIVTGDPQWLGAADALFAALTGATVQSPLAHTGILNALDFRVRHEEIVVAGPDGARLLRAALARPFAQRVVVALECGAGLAADHPARAQLAHATKEGSAAFICTAGSCSLPIHDPAALAPRAAL
jgi:uncharacterized protein YyaL (SSP411 family)